MTDPTPSPSPTPTPSATKPPPFTPNGQAVPQSPTQQQSGGQNAMTGTVAKGVWFMRPTPLFSNTSTLAGIAQASRPGNELINSWYDKSDVEGQFLSLSPVDQALFEAVAASMGNNKSGNGLFGDMVDKSAYLSTQGIRKTPQELLYEVAFQRGVLREDGTFTPASAIQDSSGNKYGTSTSKSRSVNLSDPDTARGLVDNALETYLGRRASPEEVSQFITQLHAHEKQNAKVTSTTTTTAPGGATSSSVSKGGSNAQQFAEDWARGQEGAAEFQAASGYFDAFLQALQNPADVVQ